MQKHWVAIAIAFLLFAAASYGASRLILRHTTSNRARTNEFALIVVWLTLPLELRECYLTRCV